MRTTLMLKIVLVASFAIVAGASAQQPADRPTYKALLEEGYEVTSFMFVPSELQKGNMTAACWTSFVNWLAQNMATLPCSVLK